MLGGADNPNGELPSYITGGHQVLFRNVLTNALPVLAGQHGPEYLHHLPATFLLISSRHAAAEDSTMSWGSTSPRSSC